MASVHRHGPGSLVGQEFYDLEEPGAYSFCPDSNDGSTPATQVHVVIRLKGGLDAYGFRAPPSPPMVMTWGGESCKSTR